MTGNTKRAAAQLSADHRPRQLQHEPRISRADETFLTDQANRYDRHIAQTDVRVRITNLRRELDALSVKIGIAAPGNHRDTIRMINRGLDTLARLVNP